MSLVSITHIGRDARLGIWQMDESAAADAPGRLPAGARQREIACTHALLREMTGREDVAVTHTGTGQPLMEGYHVSISHTRGYVAVVISGESRVAVDIEYRSERVRRVAGRFMREDEQAADTAQLLLHWCAKETVYKYFPDDRLRYADMRVTAITPRTEHSGEIRVENLRLSLTLHLHYRITHDYTLVYLVEE